jgi:site-specific DNA-methyltransferase (adenine-specific)
MPVSEAHNLDCMAYMAGFPDKHFELAIVDPPYGIAATACKHGSGGKLTSRLLHAAVKKLRAWDKKPGNAYFEELFRVSKNQIIWGGNYFELPPTRGIICWDKVQPWHNFSQWEMAWTSFSRPAALFRYDNRRGGKVHPTQKPIDLYAWLLKKYAKQGDKILDTHLGSGSSRIAAYHLGFDFYACEIDSDYYEAQEERFYYHTKAEQP